MLDVLDVAPRMEPKISEDTHSVFLRLITAFGVATHQLCTTLGPCSTRNAAEFTAVRRPRMRKAVCAAVPRAGLHTKENERQLCTSSVAGKNPLLSLSDPNTLLVEGGHESMKAVWHQTTSIRRSGGIN